MMASRITFLGTAGDSFIYAKQIRSSGGIVIKVDNYQIFIDPGPGSLLRAKHCGIDPRETTIIACSHSHVNHATDLNALISAMTYNGLDRHGVVVCADSVVNGYEGSKGIITDFHSGCVERVITLAPEQRVGIENLEIRALHAKHDDPAAIGLKIFTPYFVLGYTGDTGYHKSLIEQYSKCDILILNTVHSSHDKHENNLSVDDAIKIVSGAKPQLAIITHFGKTMLQEDPIIQARRIHKETGVQVIAAGDGMVISPNYYSAEMKQKTLSIFAKDKATGAKDSIIKEESHAPKEDKVQEKLDTQKRLSE